MIALFSTYRVLAHENCCGINTTRYEKHRTWPTQKSNCGNLAKEHTHLNTCTRYGAFYSVMDNITVLCARCGHILTKIGLILP